MPLDIRKTSGALAAGLAGEREHANAGIAGVFGDALRAAVGGGRAWLPDGLR
jgi:hypothetical protein